MKLGVTYSLNGTTIDSMPGSAEVLEEIEVGGGGGGYYHYGHSNLFLGQL